MSSQRTVTKHLHDETSARAQKLKAFDASAQALRVKDSMIWILLQVNSMPFLDESPCLIIILFVTLLGIPIIILYTH